MSKAHARAPEPHLWHVCMRQSRIFHRPVLTRNDDRNNTSECSLVTRNDRPPPRSITEALYRPPSRSKLFPGSPTQSLQAPLSSFRATQQPVEMTSFSQNAPASELSLLVTIFALTASSKFFLAALPVVIAMDLWAELCDQPSG